MLLGLHPAPSLLCQLSGFVPALCCSAPSHNVPEPPALWGGFRGFWGFSAPSAGERPGCAEQQECSSPRGSLLGQGRGEQPQLWEGQGCEDLHVPVQGVSLQEPGVVTVALLGRNASSGHLQCQVAPRVLGFSRMPHALIRSGLSSVGTGAAQALHSLSLSLSLTGCALLAAFWHDLAH